MSFDQCTVGEFVWLKITPASLTKQTVFMYKFNLDFFLMFLHFDAIAMVKKEEESGEKKQEQSVP